MQDKQSIHHQSPAAPAQALKLVGLRLLQQMGQRVGGWGLL